ncbi:MAG: DUF7305 domain-containing protein [Planctomycetota bacterium]|jgi:hypothetical protein
MNKLKTIRIPTGRSKQNGSVLVLIIVVVLISLFIGTGLLMMGSQTRISAIRNVHDLMARSAADAGMERAIQEINNAVVSKSWVPSVLPVEADVPIMGSDSSYSVKSQYDAASGDYLIRSQGSHRDRTRTVSAVLRLKGLFDNAIQCRDNIILKSGTSIEAIDSSISLDPDDTDEKAIIGTNSVSPDTVILNHGVTVDGDVVVGVGGDVDQIIKDQGAATGERYSLSTEVEFPPVTAPNLFGPGSQIYVASGEKTIGPGGDFNTTGRYSGIKLKNGTKLRVIGNSTLYITGDVDMGQDSEIVIDAASNASLHIYIDGNWISDNGSGINNEAKTPSQFKLFGTGPEGQQIDLKAKSEMYASIYAPNAELTVFSGGDVYGSFVAKDFELKNPANFYYDVALQTVYVNEEGSRFVVSRWNEL